MLRIVFQHKKEEQEDGEKLQNEEISNLQPSPNICTIYMINKPRTTWAGRSSRIGEIRNACKIFVEKHHGSKPHEITWCILTAEKFSKNLGGQIFQISRRYVKIMGGRRVT